MRFARRRQEDAGEVEPPRPTISTAPAERSETVPRRRDQISERELEHE